VSVENGAELLLVGCSREAELEGCDRRSLYAACSDSSGEFGQAGRDVVRLGN
jgi:hypothetical protein